MFKGSITALVTPFKNNKLDEDSYEKFIEFQISNGTNGIVPGGTTGESPTLEYFEHKKIIEIAVKVSNGRIPVIAGTGSNSTKEAIELTKFAENAKADAALIVTPYYNKPTQEGLYSGEMKDVSVVIFNSKGEVVYKSTDPDFNWNGRNMMDEPCPSGGYLLMLTAKDLRGNNIQESRDFQLLR